MENNYYTPENQEEVIDYIMSERVIWLEDINPITNEPWEIRFNKNISTSLYGFLEFINKTTYETEYCNNVVEYDFLPSNFRIKILSKEDIESFGFMEDFERRYTGHRSCYNYIINESRDKDRLGYSLDHYFNDNRVVIMIHDGYYDEIIFHGTIKNISELKRILNQTKVPNVKKN